MTKSTKMTESFVHVAMRFFLKNNGWLLIAGEYPNGSDDELNVLSISDPAVAKDNSPTPRQHSTGEFVPDLVAIKGNDILIIEAKPDYSISDKAKLLDLIFMKRERLIHSLEKFSMGKTQYSWIDYKSANYIPTLAFGNPSLEPVSEDTKGMFHLYVKDLTTCSLVGPF